MAVGAQQAQAIEAGPIARPQGMDGARVVALDKVPPALPICGLEIEGAGFANDPPESFSDIGLLRKDELPVALPGAVQAPENAALLGLGDVIVSAYVGIVAPDAGGDGQLDGVRDEAALHGTVDTDRA